MAAALGRALELDAQLRVEAETGAVGRLEVSRGSAPTPPSSPAIVASTENGSQFVGLSANPWRSSSIRIKRVRSGIPSRICGSGSETAVTWAVTGSTEIATRTATLPRS